MSKPNINLKYREQDGMMLPDLQISNSSRLQVWASATSERNGKTSNPHKWDAPLGVRPFYWFTKKTTGSAGGKK